MSASSSSDILFVTTKPPVLPATLGNYLLERRVGVGGMGMVYEATRPDRGTRVALKTLRFSDPTALYRFKREFRALSDLRHRNLVELYELVSAEGGWFFTMELVEGEDFLSYVRGPAHPLEMPITTDEQFSRLRRALVQLASGLSAVHEVGMVHRDVKGANILVQSDHRVVLLDFGLALDSAPSSDSTAGELVGTPAYMAPEQAASAPVGPAADWYSVGVLLYEVLTGVCPFDGSMIEILMQKQQREPSAASQVSADVPAELDLLCSALLRREPSERADGTSIVNALRQDGDPPSTDDLGISARSHSGRSPFIGREKQLAVLHELLASTSLGNPRAVFVRGAAGIGKSALVRQFLDQLSLSDTLVLDGRCAQRESVPYKSLDGVIDALSHHLRRLDARALGELLPPDAEWLSRLFPVLGRVPALAEGATLATAGGPHAQRARAVNALRGLLQRMTALSPIVLFIDDWQWADADGAALLTELLQPAGAPGILLIATVRDTAGSAGVASIREIDAAVVETVRMELGGLSDRQSFDLARRVLANLGISSPTEAAALSSEAAGHPLFINELAHHAAATGKSVQQGGLLKDAVRARTQQLEPAAARLLDVIALAGAPISVELASGASGLARKDCDRLVTLLRLANLVRSGASRRGDDVEPYHDRIRDAILEMTDKDARHQIHTRIADALHANDAAARRPQLLLSHLEQAGQTGRAAAVAIDAARQASDAFAYEQAVELYEVAFRLGRFVHEDEVKFGLELASALTNAGRGFEAANLYQRLAGTADPATRLVCRRRAAEQYLLNGHLNAGFEALESVLSESGLTFPKTPRRALASLLWHRFRIRVRGLRWTPRYESELPQQMLNRMDLCNAVSTSMAVVDVIRGADYQSRAMLMALRCGESSRIGRCIATEGIMQASQGRRGLARGAKLVARADQVAAEHSDPHLNGWVAAAKALLHGFGGRFSQAITGLRESETWLRDHTVGASWELASVRLFRIYAHKMMGEFGVLREQYDWLLRDAVRRGDRYTEATLSRSCNQIWLAEDDVPRATIALADLRWVPSGANYHLQHWYELRARADIDMYRGDSADTLAREAVGLAACKRSMLLRVQNVRVDYYWLLARLALNEVAAGAAPRSRWRLALRCARALDAEGVSHGCSVARLLTATVAAQRGDHETATRLLSEAVEFAAAGPLGIHGAAARRCRGILRGGARGRVQVQVADASLRALGVKNPERMVALYAAGFPS